MKATDLVTVPFQAGAAVRHRRLFHPVGVLAEGTLERLSPPGEGLPVESGPIMGRVSKGIGTPGALPDFAGLAWRMQPAPFAATPWDVLLISAGLGSAKVTVNRLLLRPVVSWAEAVYSSLMPLRHHGELWWVRARLVTAPEGGGLSLTTIRDRISDGGLAFEVEQACGTGEFIPLARLELTRAVAGEPVSDGEGRDIAFDPVRHTAPDVTLWPDWLRELRELAYRGSRQGRDAH
jgi:hypothetical protein